MGRFFFMINIICSLFILFNGGLVLYSQGKAYYIEKQPVINGNLDILFQDRLMAFKDIHKTNPSITDIKASYFIGYNQEFLYIYIEAEADSFIINDRAYQNGDGFHITLGEPVHDGSPTNKFYVLGFSPSQDWSRKFRWYWNIDLSMRILGNDVLFETNALEGKISFELLIPWKEVPPYHPWFYESIAFNLCFVKSIHQDSSERILYFIKADERMQSEQSKRKYINLSFEIPDIDSIPSIYAMPGRNNYMQNEDIIIDLAVHSKKGNIKLSIFDMEGKQILTRNIELSYDGDLERKQIIIEDPDLSPGKYRIKLEEQGYDIFIIDSFDKDLIIKTLEDHKSILSEGSMNTMLFHLNKLSNKIQNLKRYDEPENLQKMISDYYDLLNIIKESIDPFNSKRGVYRRAFISEIDFELRPYTIYIPEEYQSEKEYPLLIYLHGSGEDDTSLFRAEFIKKGFIVLAPNGRGTSNWYTIPESQTDINEAISDTMKNFNINTSRIILTGFSMGGYGVYRTFYENPQLYHSIAIISGNPEPPSFFGDKGISFLEDEMIDIFNDIPIFIYHGKMDMNCPFELTSEFVARISEINTNVTFISDDKAGHGSMSAENRALYYQWLLDLL